MLSIILLRHGKTAGNLAGRYNGRTDDPLCAEGSREAEEAQHYPNVSLVYSSPMLRARQTAGICFPNAKIVTVPDLREMDFGDFEGRTAQEMEFDSDYRAWVAGDCVERCPNGEGIPGFAQRAAAAFAGAVQDAIARGETEIGVTAHGGVIMAVMTAFSGSDAPYHTWYVLNCGGYRVTLDEAEWARTKRFSGYSLFGLKGESSDMVGREMNG
ncbi:MAG: histidine phosphatase family protein [Eubacteriales bacterium]|nr:histidine phosphatase family protein [Eubacteriales bacterium]